MIEVIYKDIDSGKIGRNLINLNKVRNICFFEDSISFFFDYDDHIHFCPSKEDIELIDTTLEDIYKRAKLLMGRK